ncbi:hypothetical protein J6590_016810 [Homalodisca vitripennis]|nr:hypothetical protein J6590_016810 [Homalodisca vitripennis]
MEQGLFVTPKNKGAPGTEPVYIDVPRGEAMLCGDWTRAEGANNCYLRLMRWESYVDKKRTRPCSHVVFITAGTEGVLYPEQGQKLMKSILASVWCAYTDNKIGRRRGEGRGSGIGSLGEGL